MRRPPRREDAPDWEEAHGEAYPDKARCVDGPSGLPVEKTAPCKKSGEKRRRLLKVDGKWRII